MYTFFYIQRPYDIVLFSNIPAEMFSYLAYIDVIIFIVIFVIQALRLSIKKKKIIVFQIIEIFVNSHGFANPAHKCLRTVLELTDQDNR